MKLLHLIPILLIAAGCGNRSIPVEGSEEWPSLTELHTKAGEAVESLSAELEDADAEQAIAEVKQSIDVLLASGIPEQIPNAEIVEQKLNELKILAADFEADPEAMKALQPLIASIMTSVDLKVPTGCTACSACGGHHDHDHGAHEHHDH